MHFGVIASIRSHVRGTTVSVEIPEVTLHGDKRGLTFTAPSRSSPASLRFAASHVAVALYELLLGAQRRAFEARAKEPDGTDLLYALADFAKLKGVAIFVGEDGDDPSIV